MAPVMEIEAERTSRPVVSRRHRVLIAAAVAAVVGGRFRILEISRAPEPLETGWKPGDRAARPVTRAVVRMHLEIRTRKARREDKHETPHHA
jgi:hypothetical protein